MPQPPAPPFVPGAQTSPRQLNRWIDINPQGGSLQRISQYIQLPVFSQAVTWRGYSEIVVAFNFEGPNNFSLKPFTIPALPNYALAVMWQSNGKTHRYWLWTGVGEVIYFPETMYSGQLIKKNFRLEVWSTNSSPAINPTIITMYTSCLGNYDYMWQLDTALVNSDAPITNFQNTNGVIGVPSDIGLAYWWKPSGIQVSGSNITSWIDSISANSMTPVVGNPTLASSGLVNNPKCMDSSTGNLGSNFTAFSQTFNTIAFGFQARNTSGGLISDLNNDNLVLYTAGAPGNIKLKNQGNTIATVTGIVNLSWYVVVVTINTLYVFNMSNGVLLGKASGVCSIGTATTIEWGGNGDYYIDLILGTIQGTANDAQNIASYFSFTYFSAGWSLPLTFPLNSIPQNN